MITAGAVYPSLSGRTVFVTSGGSGIGASVVEAFARQNSKVAFIDVDAALVQGALAGLGANCYFERCDGRGRGFGLGQLGPPDLRDLGLPNGAVAARLPIDHRYEHHRE